MIKAVMALLLLVLSKQFLTFQLTLWSGSVPREAANGACLFTHPLPQNAPQPFNHLLAFSGFQFRWLSSISFDAQVVNANSTSMEISAEVFSTLRAFEIRFFVALIDLISQWSQIEKGSIDLTNAFVGDGFNHYFISSLSKPLDNLPTSNYDVIPILQCIKMQTTSTNLQVILNVNQTFPTSVQIHVAKPYDETISLLRFSVLFLDKPVMTDLNVGHALDYVYLDSPSHPAFDPTLDRSPDYNLLSPFAINGGYQGTCFCGITYLDFNAQQATQYTFDFNSNQIVIARHASRFDGGNIYVRMFARIVCVLQPLFSGAECQTLGFARCISCSRFECLACNNQSILLNKTCVCFEGWPLGEYCNTVPGCITLILVQGSQICVQCDGVDFNPFLLDGKCRCLNNGTVINGICNSIAGCVSPQKGINGEIRCLICNSTEKFISSSSPQGLCYCQQYYQLSRSTCVKICGDGVLLALNQSLCDDGNLVNGDGCSSSCTVEDFYRCYNADPLLPSSCVYQGIQIYLTLSYAERNGEENSGTFAFTFYPRLFFLTIINFTKSTVFHCASEYSITGMDYNQGTLSIAVEFTKDLENVECFLSISYDKNISIISNSSLNFTAVSRNQELVVISEEDISKRKTIKFIFRSLSFCFIGVFLLSLCHKMIGAELAVSSQMVYLSFALYSSASYLSPALRSFSLVTGCRTLFFSQDYENMLPPFSYRAEMSLQVLENHAVWCGILLALLLIIVILKVYDHFTSAKDREESHYRNSERMKILYDHLLFPLAVFSFLFTLLSSFVNSLRSLQVQGTFLKALNGLSWLLLLLSLGLVLSQIFKVEPQPQGNDKRSRQFKKWYIPLFLVRLILLAIFLSLGITQTFSFLIFPIILLMVFYLVVIMIYRPYEGCFSNLSIILNQCLALLAVTLALANKFFTIDYYIEAFILFNMQGFIIICLVFSLIRVFLHIRSLCRKEEKERKEEQPEPKKKKTITDVDLSMYRTILGEKKQMDTYRTIIPHHFSSRNSKKRRRHQFYRVEQIQQEQNSNIQEIKDRLLTSLQRRRQMRDSQIRKIQ